MDFDIIFNNPPRARAFFHDSKLLEDVPDHQFSTRYRMSKERFSIMMDTIGDQFEPESLRNNPIPAVTKVLACLRILTSGSFQTVSGGIVVSLVVNIGCKSMDLGWDSVRSSK